ncbi:hypothetical protein C8J57DRAFT_1340823, partial [Mycena rebaudengoi]
AHFTLHVKFLLLAGFAAVVSAQTLRACNNFITTSDGDRYQLTSARKLGPYFQCDYFHDNGDGSSSEHIASTFRTSDYRLSHYPNTSLPVDSNAACPDPLPNAPDAGQYIVKVASDCATIPGASTGTAGNGSAVGIKRCDRRHGFPGQVWTFTWTGKNKCVDLTDESVEDGNQLQIWDCISSNTNQNWLLEVHFP